MVQRVKALEDLARDMVGDDKRPDVFFVSVQGNIVLVTTDFSLARNAWLYVTKTTSGETALENRTFGVIASREPVEDGSKRLRIIDDSHTFRKRR